MFRDGNRIDSGSATSINNRCVNWKIPCRLLGGDLIGGLFQKRLRPKPIPRLGDFSLCGTLCKLKLRLK
jgi:hypothetical protein